MLTRDTILKPHWCILQHAWSIFATGRRVHRRSRSR